MKRYILRIAAVLLAAAMLLTVCACSGNNGQNGTGGTTAAAKPDGNAVFDYDLDTFIADVNDYLHTIVVKEEDVETGEALYESIKLTKERFTSVADDELPYDNIDYFDSTPALISSLYCFKNPANGRYNDIAVFSTYDNYFNNINSYFIYTVLSAACACAVTGTDKNDQDAIMDVYEFTEYIFHTVNLAGSASELVRYGDACFYSVFTNVSDDAEPSIFFHMVPTANCSGYVESDAFIEKVKQQIAEEEAKEAAEAAAASATDAQVA